MILQKSYVVCLLLRRCAYVCGGLQADVWQDIGLGLVGCFKNRLRGFGMEQRSEGWDCPALKRTRREEGEGHKDFLRIDKSNSDYGRWANLLCERLLAGRRGDKERRLMLNWTAGLIWPVRVIKKKEDFDWGLSDGGGENERGEWIEICWICSVSHTCMHTILGWPVKKWLSASTCIQQHYVLFINTADPTKHYFTNYRCSTSTHLPFVFSVPLIIFLGSV